MFVCMIMGVVCASEHPYTPFSHLFNACKCVCVLCAGMEGELTLLQEPHREMGKSGMSER